MERAGEFLAGARPEVGLFTQDLRVGDARWCRRACQLLHLDRRSPPPSLHHLAARLWPAEGRRLFAWLQRVCESEQPIGEVVRIPQPGAGYRRVLIRGVADRDEAEIPIRIRGFLRELREDEEERTPAPGPPSPLGPL